MKRMKRVLSVVLVAVMLLCAVPVMEASAIDGRVENAIQMAIAIANDQSHGYSQNTRYGNPNYDCSSLVCSVFYRAGFNVTEWGTTATMVSSFKNAGFAYITNINFSSYASLQRGDILWKSGHTEIYIGNGQLVGAHSNKATTSHPNRSTADGDQGDEISVCSYYNAPWSGVLRFSGSSTITSWNISDPNTYLSYPGYYLKSGTKDSYVKFLQTGLNTLGYSCGNIDGDFGSNTKNAVIAFQRANGLSADGVVGPDTWNRLINNLKQKYNSIKIHYWFSFEALGSSDHDYKTGETLYLCYEFLDSNGTRIDYSPNSEVQLKILNPSGTTVKSSTISNETCGYIGATATMHGVYYGILSYGTTEYTVSVPVKCTAVYSVFFSKNGSSFNDALSNEVENGKIGDKVYGWFGMYDNNTKLTLDKVYTFNHSVKMSVYFNESLLGSKEWSTYVYSNYCSFTPQETGTYKIVVEFFGDGIKSGLSKTVFYTVECSHEYGNYSYYSQAQHKQICSVCGKTTYSNHIWNSGIITKTATCTTTGTKTYTCTVCKATKTETIYALGHNYGAWTKLNDTQHQRVCSRDSSHIERTNHDWDSDLHFAAATCTVCNATRKSEFTVEETTEEVNMWQHTHSYTSKITKAATCSATGVKTYTCSCGASKTESIPVNTSNHVNTRTVAATASTCTTKGYSVGVYCNDCKKYISGHQQQPLAAHKTTIINAKDATYDAEGYTGDEYCTVCKQTLSYGTVLPMLTKPNEPTNPDDLSDQADQPERVCQWCGGHHKGIFQIPIGFFHMFLAMIFGARY